MTIAKYNFNDTVRLDVLERSVLEAIETPDAKLEALQRLRFFIIAKMCYYDERRERSWFRRASMLLDVLERHYEIQYGITEMDMLHCLVLDDAEAWESLNRKYPLPTLN